jgi:hypothetical protein
MGTRKLFCTNLARNDCVDDAQIEVVDPNKYMLQNNIPFQHQSPSQTPN